MSINQIKQYIFVNIPICTFGCILMIMFEKFANIKLSVIPFIIWGIVSTYITECICEYFNLWKE